MNSVRVAVGLFGLGAAALSGQAMAACPALGAEVPNLNTFLSGKTVCMKKNETWKDSRGNTTSVVAGYQEEHHSNFELWDYKQGDNPPSTPFPNPPSVDPRKKVGNWAYSTSTNEVSYTYTDSGGPYTYKLFNLSPLSSTNYCLVGNGEQLEVIVQVGTGAACAAYPPPN